MRIKVHLPPRTLRLILADPKPIAAPLIDERDFNPKGIPEPWKPPKFELEPPSKPQSE